MISPQQMDILWVLQLVAEQQSYHFNAEATSIDVISQEEHLLGLR